MTRNSKKMAVKLIMLLLPIFITWKLLAPYAILPIVASTTSQILKALFTQIQPQIVYIPSTDTWQVKSQMFNASQPYPNNTFKPNLNISGTTSISLGTLITFTLNFPLFWLLMLTALNKQHWKMCSYNLAKGSLIILLSTCFYVVVKAVYQITKLLQSSDLLRVYHDPYIQIPPTPPDWLIVVLKPLLDTFGYINALVIPIGLTYYYCYPLFITVKNEHAD